MTATSIQQASAKITTVDAALVEKWLAEGDAVLIDVREPFEYAEERIAAAELAPLSTFNPDALRARHPSARFIFQCRSGKRASDAANRFARAGEPVYCLAGGIDGWKATGRPTVKPETGARLPVMRQVQLTAGFLVTLGVALGYFVSPWFLALSAFVGCGLMFAGASGWCGMAMLLAKMPWNKAAAPR